MIVTDEAGFTVLCGDSQALRVVEWERPSRRPLRLHARIGEGHDQLPGSIDRALVLARILTMRCWAAAARSRGWWRLAARFMSRC